MVGCLGRVIALVLVLGACTPAQAPIARTTGKWMSLGGVGGLVTMAFAAPYVDQDPYLISAFSLISAIGIATFAAGDLAKPAAIEETTSERHTRWAKILTERAINYASEGNCARVRRVEPRVAAYDREVHDIVFMRDEGIQKCMAVRPEEDPPATPPDRGQSSDD